MAGQGHSVNDEIVSTESEVLTSNTSCLSAEEGARCTRKDVDGNVLREQGDKGTCFPPHRASTVNKLLWCARLELRHTVQEGLFLASLRRSSHAKTQLLDATTLVHKLLTRHQCLTAQDVDNDIFEGPGEQISDALRGNRFIRFLKINVDAFGLRDHICSAITTLANLKELEFSKAGTCTAQLCAALVKLLRMPTKVTTLRIPDLRMKVPEVNAFLSALAENSTLGELSFHTSVLNAAGPEERALFVHYLAEAKTLRKLTVSTRIEVGQLYLPCVVLEGLVANTSLTEVDLCGFLADAKSVDIITEVFTHNQTLRAFGISLLTHETWTHIMKAHVMRSEAWIHRDFSAWLPALAANETLEAVSLPLNIWDPEQWEVFFESMSAKASPPKLTIYQQCADRRVFEKLSDALQRKGMEEYVFFNADLDVSDKLEMIACKGFSQLSSFPYGDHGGRASRVFRMLPSIAHVTAADLSIWRPWVDEKFSSDIAHYIPTSSALKELHLTMYPRGPRSVTADTDVDECLAIIVESLRRNTSVSELHFSYHMSVGEVELLADAVKCNRNVRRVHVEMQDSRVGAAFVRRLRDGIERNRNLLHVTMRDRELRPSGVDKEWFAIWDTTRRNSDVVARAAQFVTGTVVDRYSVEALELAVEYPSLLQEVAHLLSVSDAEAAALARTTLKSIQSLDAFMRLVGVVKDSVTCYSHEDGHTQLDDINEDCWSLVRHYLKVEDVGDREATAETEDLPRAPATL